jgi:Ig-like domain CHU_C associated
MKKNIYVLLLILLAVIQSQAQITFKLKSVVGQQNPSSNGLFSYGTLNNGTFQLFPHYGEDGTGDINGISQKGWTFVLGQENYPFLAFEQLNAGEVTPQPFPPFGIFMHPSNDAPSVVKLSIPNNATIVSITNNVQRPSFGCGENIGYSIITDNSIILSRTIIPTSSSPNVYMVGAMPINAGNNIYFVVDKGEDGNNWCDDTALDVEITLQYDKIVTPTLSGTLNCNATSATFDIAFQPSGTLELYKLGNPSPISSTTISQVGNSFNGQGTFSGLDFSAGGSYYVIAKNNEQEQSEQSTVINVSPCCTNAVAPSISVNNLSLCQGNIGTLTATGCTNGTITWSNGVVGTSTIVNVAGTYTATCKVLATPPCLDATSTASSVVTVNALPTITVDTTFCSADLLTYTINFSGNGVVTTSAGTVSGNSVINIPAGLDVTLTVTNSVGCIVTQTINSPTCNCPIIDAPVSDGNKNICQGQIIPNLTVSVGENTTTDWYDANLILVASNTLSYLPTTTQYPLGGTFYVQARNLQNNCVSTTRTPVSLTINSLPTLSAGIPACSTDLLTYSVSFTSDGVVISSAGIVSNNIVSGIPTGTNIVLTATSSAGCITTQKVNSPFCNCPTVNLPISAGDKTICAGQAIPTLSLSVGNNEIAEWYDAPSGGNLLATGLSFTPNVATGISFYVQSKNTITNCVSATRTSVSLTINSLPTLSAGIPTCSTDLLTYSVSFTSDGVVISSAGIVSNNIVSGIPTGTNVVLTATSSAGCITTQTVNSPSCTCPTVNLPISGGDKTICSGQAIPTLSVSVGSNEVTEWYDVPNGGNLLATGSSYTPSSEAVNNGLFYVQAKNTTNNCTSNARILVKLIVNSNGATPSIVASKNPLVLGETATLSISNCNGIILWNTGESTVSISVTPKASTEYSATCTASGGCVGGNGKIIIEVNAPKITVKASPNVVCVGGTTTLSMSGCPSNNIYWTSPEYGRRDENAPVFNGIVQAVSFTGHCVTSAGEATETIGVNIRQPQDFQIIASKNPIVLGESTVLSTTGCDGVVSWQNGQASGNPITVWPTSRYTDYVAECLSPNACGGKGKIIIEVKPPVIQATGKDVCWGSTPSLGQTGCTTAFYWVVWKKDDFSDAKSIENPNTYQITERTRFRVSCSTSAGESEADITINPIPLPDKPNIGSERTTYFLGETVRIGTGGCNGLVRWSTGENDVNTIEVKPRHSTKYTVTCVGGYGCTNSNEIEITMITPPPTAKDQTICYGDTIKLVSGCMKGTEVHWTKNWMDIPNRVEVPEGFQEQLTESNTYAVSCYSHETGWSEAIAIKVTVKAKITPPTITAKDVEKTAIIVKGETIELLANACNQTEWKAEKVLMADTLNKRNAARIQVKPLQTTTYHARCFTEGCYSEWNQFKVYVRPKMPVVTATADTLCVGSSTTITAKNCEDGGNLVWLDDRNLKDLSFAVSPKSDIKYRAICVGLDSLVSDTTSIFIKVYQTPQKPIISGNLIILDGEKTTLTASGCNESLLWNTGEKSQSIVVRPEKNTVYSATCGIWQCISDTASVKVRVRPRPIEIETSNGIRGYSITDTLCLNKQLSISTLTQCNGTIVWSNGQSGEKIEVTGRQVEMQKYSLYCINADNEKSDESTATITVLDYNINEAIAYPNPTSGKLYIKSKGCIDGVKLILYSQRGEILYEGGGQERYLDSIVLDLFNLPSETYILYIVGIDGSKPVTLKKRIVKVNN